MVLELEAWTGPVPRDRARTGTGGFGKGFQRVAIRASKRGSDRLARHVSGMDVETVSKMRIVEQGPAMTLVRKRHHMR